tara:strand:+ start:117 stop:386 length:270 start_codon:yes stop_codon:yes gene_type:complete
MPKTKVIVPETYEGKTLPFFARDSLERYINDRVPPGHFLRALLSNDLVGSFARADETNQELIGTYVKWLYNFAPSYCWGSPEKVSGWLD